MEHFYRQTKIVLALAGAEAVAQEGDQKRPDILFVDFEEGYGNWKVYQSFEVPSGKQVTHRFPDGFSAYWVRAVSQTETMATAQLRYE